MIRFDATPKARRPERSLAGLEAEYRVALAEGKTTLAKAARVKARGLAMATGQIVPDWVSGWDP